jgi:hypothetical protein
MDKVVYLHLGMIQMPFFMLVLEALKEQIVVLEEIIGGIKLSKKLDLMCKYYAKT